MVSFPFDLDMSKYVDGNSQDHTYELFAVLIHSGSALGGVSNIRPVSNYFDSTTMHTSNPLPMVNGTTLTIAMFQKLKESKSRSCMEIMIHPQLEDIPLQPMPTCYSIEKKTISI